MLDHVTRERESLIIKEKQGFYYKQGVVVHFTLALFETDTLDITVPRFQSSSGLLSLWRSSSIACADEFYYSIYLL